VTQMRNIIFLLTSCAASICYAMGDEVKSYVLIGIVFFVCTINTIGEYSGQDPGRALREQMNAEAVVAIREGREASVQAQDLVVGDVVKLHMGDVVPADMLILECVDLQTNEAVLTGEPTEQQKSLVPKKKDEAFLSNMVYSGTSVVSGTGKGEVVATGMRSQVGLIAKRLKGQGDAKTLNPLQESINLLGMVIGCICVVVIVVATSVSFATGYQNPMTPCADDDDTCLLLTSAARGLIMAVSIIPHGLPFVVMVMLRVGSREMAARNAMVTRRSVVDYLGATTVICTDKTGTLTQGKMTAKAIFGLCRTGTDSETAAKSHLEFYPMCGLSPNGGVFSASKLSPEAKQRMDTKFDLKQTRQVFAEPGLPDLSAPHDADQRGLDAQLLHAHLVCGFLTCYSTKLIRDIDSGAWSTVGNMTEAAVKVAAAKGGFWDEDKNLPTSALQCTYDRDAGLEVPFTSKRKMSATVHAVPADQLFAGILFDSGVTHCAIVKGAPEVLLPHVTSVLLAGDGGRLNAPGGELSVEERDVLQAQNDALASQALRSLAVAVCPVDGSKLQELRGAPGAEERLAALLSSPGLCFLSLWGIYDPPRAAVPGSVKECHSAGIRVVMITGDQRPTAMAIGQQVNIIQDDRDPEKCSALCKELQQGACAVNLSKTSGRRLSMAASACLKENLTQWDRKTSGDSPLSTIAEETSSNPSGRKKTRMLSVHDVRKDDDHHEPKYLPEDKIAEMTSRINVWARAQPTDKVAIVDSLINQDHIAAMTGDGVNDAPALKRASAGVAMGISGTPVAKNASDLILMDDDFSTIVAAIREGRRIYSNTQKYVTFNLSVKAGECVCLMSAIAFGVPMPIRGLQLLFNLLTTHILPPLSLAWERPESYLMQVPPRQTKGDAVVSSLMVLFKWLPFVICMPSVVMCCLAVGVWTNTGFIRGNDLIGSSRVGAVDKGLVACEFAGALDDAGRFLDDARPFHCRCQVRYDGSPFTAPTQVDQWGRSVDDVTLSSSFDRWTGSTGHIFEQQNTLWRDGVDSFLERCVDRRGVERWCWRDGQASVSARPLLPVAQNCAAYGAVLGQSMSYVSIHAGEIFTLMSFRTDGFFAPYICSNRVYVGFLAFNLLALTVFIYFQPVSDLLELAPLAPTRFAIAVGFAGVLVVCNELAKIIYRSKVGSQNEVLRKKALQRSLSNSPAKKSLSGDMDA